MGACSVNQLSGDTTRVEPTFATKGWGSPHLGGGEVDDEHTHVLVDRKGLPQARPQPRQTPHLLNKSYYTPGSY